MAIVMNSLDFVSKIRDVAENHKTLYVMGCFGAPMMAKNRKRYSKNHSYNKQTVRKTKIQAASADTFGFDCIGLIKGVLWGWNGNTAKTYGGAKYIANGVPDKGANSMIKVCKNVSTDFSKIEVGEVVWMDGHIGVYIGDGLAVESTPAWKDGVQITAVGNLGAKRGYSNRIWTKHGKLPYVDYTQAADTKPSKETDPAKIYNKSVAGSYKVVPSSGLNMRTGAGTKNKKLCALKKNTVVQNYGYYSLDSDGVKWLLVEAPNGKTGYCSSEYLSKC